VTLSRRTARVDENLLASLQATFARYEGDAGFDAAALQRALGMRSAYLAQRVFARFDANGDGRISREEFLAGVRALILGSEDEKLRFAFALHDVDDDGFLGPQDVYRMVALSLAEDDLEGRASQPPDDLAHAVMASADRDRDGKISRDEFAAAVRACPSLLRRMTRSEAQWIAPSEDLLARIESSEPRSLRLRRALRGLRNRASSLAVAGVWLAANLAVIASALRDEHVDLAMRWARATGNALGLNAALVLVPVLRRLLTRVRAGALGRWIPVDHALDLHRLIGHALAALTVAHLLALATGYAVGHPQGDVAAFLVGSRRLATGTALLGVYAVMWTLSLRFVRRSRRFELFFYSHALYALWFALLFAHAPASLRWVAAPLLAFAVEQLLRVRRSGAPTEVVRVEALRSGVVRLDLRRPPGFTFAPGDYVFLKIPAVAPHEWHPFTLSSAPERDELSVHVRALGDWTSALRARVTAMEDGAAPSAMAVHVDGPYGSPTTHLFRARRPVMIGAGIGVTPFASVLESLMSRVESGAPLTPQRVHFVWLNRDQYAFEWFADLLEDLERRDRRGFFDLRLFMTEGREGATALGLELAREVQREHGRKDLVTGLRGRTRMGQPDWDALLRELAEASVTDPAEVFFCGPPGLGAKVRAACARLRLPFREEVF
jgi:predicted ferric reductase/Ca2+-binding EF-hand superfamily protein